MDSNIKKRIRDKAPRLPNWDMDMLIEAVAEEYGSEFTFCSGILTFIEELASDCDPKRIRSDFKQKTCVTLTQKEVAAMLANAFLCRVPCLDLKQPKIGINFHGLFSKHQLSEEKKSSRREKIKCILRYFNVINSTANKLEGEVTYKRRSLHKFPSIDEAATTTLTAFKVQEDRSLSDATGMPQVLFAKKRFGASALGNGYLQEDIKLVTCPELLLAKLFPGELRDNEAIIVTGAHAYVKTTGRASSFFVEDVVLDLKRSDSSPIIAIDAADFGGDRNQNDQYTRAAVEREWKKAYVGFSAVGSEYNTIATGNWGCGVSKGDPEWKMKIQWLAASLAGKNLEFYTFSNERLAQTAHRVERDWSGRSIVELYCALMEGNRASPPMQQPAPEVPRNLRLPTRASGSDSRAETSNDGFAVPHQNPRREQELPMGNLHYSTEDSVPFGFAVTSRGLPKQPCHCVGPKQEPVVKNHHAVDFELPSTSSAGLFSALPVDDASHQPDVISGTPISTAAFQTHTANHDEDSLSSTASASVVLDQTGATAQEIVAPANQVSEDVQGVVPESRLSTPSQHDGERSAPMNFNPQPDSAPTPSNAKGGMIPKLRKFVKKSFDNLIDELP